MIIPKQLKKLVFDRVSFATAFLPKALAVSISTAARLWQKSRGASLSNSHFFKLFGYKSFVGLFFFFIVAAYGHAAIIIPESSLEEPKNILQGVDEINAMNHLMESTAHQLEVQKQMRQLMVDFQRQKEEFIQGNQTKAHAAEMVRTARQIYETITAHHLQYLFSKEYLDELLFFSSIAGKNKMKNA